VRTGDFVAVLDELYEIPSYCWRDDVVLRPRDELVRIWVMPTKENPPLKVKAVCLPFVLVKRPLGECHVLDVRRLRLARLDQSYGRAVWKAYRKHKPATTSPEGSTVEKRT
jgi:hypothetical protein